jgi:hypothetical protein
VYTYDAIISLTSLVCLSIIISVVFVWGAEAGVSAGNSILNHFLPTPVARMEPLIDWIVHIRDHDI